MLGIRIVAALTIGWFAVAGLGCGGNSGPDRPNPARQPASMGDSLTVHLHPGTDAGDLTVTPIRFDSNPPVPDPAIYEPTVNTRWARVELRVANDSDSTSRQSAVEYMLVSSDGFRVLGEGSNAFEPVISCCGSGYPGDSMQPGDKAEGFVAFQVPEDFKASRFRASGVPDGSVVEWTLGD